MTMPKTSVDFVDIHDNLEAVTLRSALEWWQVQVRLHPIGQAKDLVSVLGGSQHLAPIVILMCHGDDRGILLPELGAELEAEQPYHHVLTPTNVLECVHVPNRVVINTGCATGTTALADAFLGAGAQVYIGPEGYVEADASLFYMFQLCYEWICKGRPLLHAHARACAWDAQTGLFRMFERSDSEN